MAFMGGIMASASGLSRSQHLPTVTTISQQKLDLLCDQFNLVRIQVNFKGFKQTYLDYLASIGIKKTEELQTLLNQAVHNPTERLKKTDPRDKLKGPMLLAYLVDYMWLLILEPVTPDKIVPYTKMYDPDTDGGNTGPMLSPRKHGFKNLGVAFRGDTRSFAQFTQAGFIARFAVPPGDPFHVRETYGTVAAQGMAFDRCANDFANQTGVCVARNIVGSMKFIGNADKGIKTGYMYAVKFNTGVDTERMQIDKQRSHGKSVLWRAGEKAAWEIPKWRFISSCKFEVSQPYSDSNRTFQYRRLSNWTYHWQGVSQLREYVEASTAKMPLNQWLDFSTTDDWASES
jgi:hypothetical protein